MTQTSDTAHDIESALHRAQCSECSAIWTELEEISHNASRLPALKPSRNLWDGIENRIRPRWHSRPAVRMAIAASLLVAVTSGITWRVASWSVDPDTTPLAAVSTNSNPADLRQVSYDETVATMDQEIALLQGMLAARRGTLDSATIAIVEQNLTLIDAAIAESRAALQSDPGNAFLASHFARSYTSKLSLLRDAVTTPTDL